MDEISAPRSLPPSALSRGLATMHEEGVRTDGSVFLSFRNETISALCNHLKKFSVVLVHAPSYSGKTSLCQLLSMRFMEVLGASNFCFQTMLGSTNFNTMDALFKCRSGKGLNYWMEQKTPTFLLIDELQITYGWTDSFWECV